MASLVIDGTPRPISFGFRSLKALRDAERLMTRSVTEVLGQHGALFKFDELIILLWAAWSQQDRKLSVKAVTALVEHYLEQGGTVLEIQSAVSEALLEAGLLTRADEEGAGDGRPPVAMAREDSASPS